MKIIYIAPQPIPSTAANSIHVMKINQALAQLGHDVTLFFQKSGGRKTALYEIYGVQPLFKLSPKTNLRGPAGTILYALHNTIAARLINPDLIFSRHLLSAWLCAIIGLPVLFEIHDSPDSLRPLNQKIFRALTSRENINFAVISQALSIHLQQRHDVPAAKITLAPDGADLLPSPGPCPFEKKPGSFHAGYTGHLYKGRGIEIIGEMAAQLPAVTFHIVGGRPENINYWQQKFTGLDNVIFHGHVLHAAVKNYLQHFDVLLAPYQEQVAVAGNTGDTGRWMSPLKIFEYMAAGKPMICSDLPVLREVLSLETALLCPPADAKKWTESLSFLQNHSADAARLGQNALAVFNENYTWLKRAEKIMNDVNHHAG